MINTKITFSDLIVYWDLTDCPGNNAEFYVYINNEFVLKTEKKLLAFLFV